MKETCSPVTDFNELKSSYLFFVFLFCHLHWGQVNIKKFVTQPICKQFILNRVCYCFVVPEPMDVENAEKTGYMKTELISVSEVWVWVQLKLQAASSSCNVANDCWCTSVPSTCRHPSRLQDMMPMSPDDYLALQQIAHRDLAAMVSVHLCLSLVCCQVECFVNMLFMCLSFLLRCPQGDNLICGFEEFATEVEAALAHCMRLSPMFVLFLP